MLDIWLPLINNIDNQGIEEINIETNAAISESGMFGNCYSFNGVNTYIKILNYNLQQLQNFSVAFWLRDMGGQSNTILLSLGNVKITRTSTRSLKVDENTSDLFLIPNNEWVHICLIKNGDTLYLYKQGRLFDTISYDSIFGNNNITIGYDDSELNNYYGLITDFRLYNDIISSKEVNVISKGLLLHLPLSTPGNHNLLRLSNVSGNNLKSYETTINGVKFTKANNVGDIQIPSSLFTINDQYTLSFKFQKIAGSLHNIYIYGIAYQFNNLYIDGELINSYEQYELQNDDYVHSVIITFKYIGSGDDPDLHITLNNSDNNFITATLFNIKIESGIICTAWNPNENEGLYDDMGYSDNVIYDTSGFSNNFVSSAGYMYFNFADEFEDLFIDENLDYIISSDDRAISELGWFSGSPRYSGCYTFNGIDQRMYGIINIGMVFTVSCWVYINDVPNSIAYIISLNNDFGTTDQQFAISISDTNFVIAAGGESIEGDTFSINQWYHLCLTCDGFIAKSYINGLLNNSFVPGEVVGNNCNIGARSNSLSNETATDYFNGNICDVRIYATCLNNNDVQALYSTPISISNNQSLYIQGDFIEL